MWKIAATLFTVWWTRLYLYRVEPRLPRFMIRWLRVFTNKTIKTSRFATCSRAMFRWAALNLAMRMHGSDLKKVVAFLMAINQFGRCSFSRIRHEHDNWGYLSYHYDDVAKREVVTIVRSYGHCTNKKPLLKARDVFGL